MRLAQELLDLIANLLESSILAAAGRGAAQGYLEGVLLVAGRLEEVEPALLVGGDIPAGSSISGSELWAREAPVLRTYSFLLSVGSEKLTLS